MTVHAVVEKDAKRVELKREIRHSLQHMEVEHVTIEMEFEGEECAMVDC
jgi:Co/Zn/Cd efflux system component